MPKPERYVVHIYRREGSGREMRAAGLLEKIEDGSQHAFSSEAELWALLSGEKRLAPGTGRKGRKPKPKMAP